MSITLATHVAAFVQVLHGKQIYLSQDVLLQDAPFFTVKLQVKMLPCLIFFQNGVACDRAVGFDDYGASDDFCTTAVERRLLKSGETDMLPFGTLSQFRI